MTQEAGLYAVRVVAGDSEREAAANAIELLKGESELLSVLVESPPEEFCAEVESEVVGPRAVSENRGYIFFDDE